MSLQCKIVDQNEFAFIALCSLTGQLQLSFGNIALLMSAQEFVCFLSQVNKALKTSSQDHCPYCRNIVIDTTMGHMAFIFSLQDLMLLQEVVQRTRMLLEADSILKSR